jgi:FixJ family two-component response regulator
MRHPGHGRRRPATHDLLYLDSEDVGGQFSKNIAADLGVSQRTVEHHRSAVMARPRAKSLADLIRMVAFRRT